MLLQIDCLLTKWGRARMACEVAACTWRHMYNLGTLKRGKRIINKLLKSLHLQREKLAFHANLLLPSSESTRSPGMLISA